LIYLRDIWNFSELDKPPGVNYNYQNKKAGLAIGVDSTISLLSKKKRRGNTAVKKIQD